MKLLPPRLTAVFVTTALVVVICGVITYMVGLRVLHANAAEFRRHAVVQSLESVMSTLIDAETGQRGYLLVGDETYLEPYYRALSRIEADLRQLDLQAADGEISPVTVNHIRTLTKRTIDDLGRHVALRRKGDFHIPFPASQLDAVKAGMDEFRSEIARQITLQRDLLMVDHETVQRATHHRTLMFIVSALICLGFIAWAYRKVSEEIAHYNTAAAEVSAQRELYATTLASIGDAVVTTDATGRVTFINKIAQDLSGWTGDEVIGKPLRDFFRIINESTRLPVESPVDKVLRLGTIVGLANHTLLIRKDGSEVPIDDSGAPIRQADGSIRGVVLVFRDFSEFKRSEAVVRQSEERLRLAIDAADLGTFYCTMPLNKIVWNDKCKEHFWLPPETEVDFDLFYARLHPDDREPTRIAIERAQSDRVPYDVEYRTVSPEGRVRWVRAMGRFYFHPNGDPARFDGITVDVTDRKRYEQELQHAQAQAEDANRAKDQFLATLSHELRTPLTPVLAMLGMWDSGAVDLPAPLRAQVQMLRRNVELEARLIDDLLDLTRVVKGKLVLATDTVDVHDILMNVANVCEEERKSKNVQISMKLNAHEPRVKADSARLQQVFWNILRNAIKFSPSGSSVDVQTSDGAEGQLKIRFSDHGIGMAPETLGRLFRPFEQGGQDVTRRFGGLGLGLAISKALVDAHGGTLTAESDGPGNGSAFTVTLKALDESATRAPADASPANPASTNGKPPLRVLIVEDHLDTAHILSIVVRSWGHQVEIADSVVRGVQAAKDQPFDIILSDIGLPDGTGLDLIRQVRVFSQVPAIALTGFGMDEDIAQSRTAGFNAHLTKPTDLSDLEQLLYQLTRT